MDTSNIPLLAMKLTPAQDASVGINILRQAEADQVGRNQRNLLREVGQTAASGAPDSLLKAAGVAFQGGDLKTATDLQNFSVQQQKEFTEALARGAERADTPALWRAYISTVEQTFGPEQVEGFRDFSARPNALTVLERATLHFKKTEASAPTAKMREAEFYAQLPEGDPRKEYMAGKKPKPSETDKKVQALLERGVSRADAEDVVYGVSQVVTDPTLQTPMLVNKLTREARPLMPGQNNPSAQLPSPPAPGGNAPAAGLGPLYDRADDATGILRSGQRLWTDIAPQVPLAGREGYPETVEAQQEFAVAVNDLIRALSINPKFPVAEMERIRKEIDVGPSAFRSAESVQASMRATDRTLRARLDNERRASRDPNLPAEARRNALQAANDIENFLNRMGVPQAGAAKVELSIRDGKRARNPKTGETIEFRNGKWVQVQ